MKTLIEIKDEVESQAMRIAAAGSFSLPTYDYTEDDARPHIEVDSSSYHMVVVKDAQ